MEQTYYNEMTENVRYHERILRGKNIFVFGHCEASLTLINTLKDYDINPVSILDNSREKYGLSYNGIPVVAPKEVLNYDQNMTAVLIVTRFYEAMYSQLRQIGFKGDIFKLVDYNTYAEYSFSEDTITRKLNRVSNGIDILNALKDKYKESMLILCPYNALGDVYFCMSYLQAYLSKKGRERYAVCVPSNACAVVVRLFGTHDVEVFGQRQLDALIQAAIYTMDPDCFIAHQDRPYVIDLHKALKQNKIPLDKIYCCGVFGLEWGTEPRSPEMWKEWNDLEKIAEGKGVILSPYAKSVTALPTQIWEDIIKDYNRQGFQVFTNVCGDEEPLDGTEPLRAGLSEMKSIVERAGTFIALRSGLCDVLRTASCRKIALFPDYYYCDTKWKSIDMYSIEGFDNVPVRDGETWERIKNSIA